MSLYYQLLHLASNCNFCCQCIWFALDVIDANKSAILLALYGYPNRKFLRSYAIMPTVRACLHSLSGDSIERLHESNMWHCGFTTAEIEKKHKTISHYYYYRIYIAHKLKRARVRGAGGTWLAGVGKEVMQINMQRSCFSVCLRVASTHLSVRL